MTHYSAENISLESSHSCGENTHNAPTAAQELPVLSRELAHAWLTWQCQMVAGIIRAAVFLPNEIKPNCSTAIWPTTGNCEMQLVAVTAQAFKKKGSVKFSKIGYGPDQKRLCDLVACPILLNNSPIAYVAVAISIRSEPQQHAVLQLLRWGGLWVETLIREQQTRVLKNSTFPQKIATSVLAQPSAKAAAIEAVNRIADEYSCERVSIGFCKGPLVRLEALSHVSRFDTRTQFVRAIEDAMEESVDQNCTIIQPDSSEETLSKNRRAHTKLTEKHGKGAICTIPLQGQTALVGAITLERPANLPFNKQTVLLLELVMRQLALVLELKQKDEFSLRRKMLDSLMQSTASLIGPSYLRLKLLSMALLVMLFAASQIDGTHVVRSPASIEGSVRQLLIAPQSGYIKQALVRAGDNVKQGQLLATLDDENLKLELQKWQSERNQTEKKYQQALASGDRTEVGISKAQLDQVDAELQLTNNALSQARLKAPFSGIVISGDLSQSLGAPVEIGQVMFEIAPLDNYRVVLEVDEHNIDGLELGKTGHLIVAALPQSSFEFSVEQIVPLAVTGTSNTFFRVEASLIKPSEHLRPGMRGVAKVELGERKLLWVWTHTLVDRIRLWAWSVGF